MPCVAPWGISETGTKSVVNLYILRHAKAEEGILVFLTIANVL